MKRSRLKHLLRHALRREANISVEAGLALTVFVSMKTKNVGDSGMESRQDYHVPAQNSVMALAKSRVRGPVNYRILTCHGCGKQGPLNKVMNHAERGGDGWC